MQHCVWIIELLLYSLPLSSITPSLTEVNIKLGTRRREFDEMRPNCVSESLNVIEIWECEWMWKKTNKVELQVRKDFRYRHSVTKYQLFEGKQIDKLFDYVQCNLKEPKNFSVKVAYFPPLFWKTRVSKDDISYIVKLYAKRKRKLFQLQEKLTYICTLQNGKQTSPLLLCYLELGLLCTKTKQLPEKTFK